MIVCTNVKYRHISSVTNKNHNNVPNIDNTYIKSKIDFDIFLHLTNSTHAKYSFREAVCDFT